MVLRPKMGVERVSSLGRIPVAVNKSLLELMRRVVEALRVDMVYRLNKPRTGGKLTKKFRGVKGSRVKIRTSGPPKYPQVLSQHTGRAIESIKGQVITRPGEIEGRVGSMRLAVGSGMSNYLRIHEFQNRGRSWLRPSLRDMEDEIRKAFRDGTMKPIQKILKEQARRRAGAADKLLAKLGK